VVKPGKKKRDNAIATNRKAFRDYYILEKMEAGLVLLGTEVKSLREGRANLRDSFARIKDGEAYLYNVHISPYGQAGTHNNHEPKRTRKLLLHRRELNKLLGRVAEKGLTLVPLKLYFKRGKVKVELALAKGKRLYDKREVLKARTHEREVAAALKYRKK
jgi:SsrA-binding protein